jgi:hypothetical protein
VTFSASIHAADGMNCPYCGRVMSIGTKRSGKCTTKPAFPTRDHVVPRGHRQDTKVPIVMCCFECNNYKGGMTLEQWLVVLRTNDSHRVSHVERFMNRNQLTLRAAPALRSQISIDDGHVWVQR